MAGEFHLDEKWIRQKLNQIKALLENSDYGLAALRSLIDAVDTVVDSIYSEVANVDHGLAALKVLLDAIGVEVVAIEAKLDHADHGLAALRALLDDVKAETDKWPGDEAEGTASGLDLNGGVATSGQPGADVFTIPATGRIEILVTIVSMRNCTAGATITIRAYTNVNGVEDLIYSQTFTQGTDPNGIQVINGNYGANEPVRFEMHSNNAADTNVDAPYKGIWRNLE